MKHEGMRLDKRTTSQKIVVVKLIDWKKGTAFACIQELVGKSMFYTYVLYGSNLVMLG